MEPAPSAKEAIPGGVTLVRSKARSTSAPGAITVAFAISPKVGATEMLEQPSTRWWLVSTLPSSATTKPDHKRERLLPSMLRSEERSVGQEWDSTCRTRWSAYHKKNKNNK